MEQNRNPQQPLFNDQEAKLQSFLKAVPYLSFSEVGLRNIAGRFHLSLEQLKVKISEFEKSKL